MPFAIISRHTVKVSVQGRRRTAQFRQRGPTPCDPLHPTLRKPCHRRMSELRRVLVAVGSASAAQQPPPPSPDLQAKVAGLLQNSEELELEERWGEAVALLRQGLEELQQEEGAGAALPVLLLRQCISGLLFSAGDYPAAVLEARAVYDAICSVSGHGSREAALFGLRLGILEAANGELEQGTERIREGGALAGDSLQRSIARGREMQAQGARGEGLKEAEAYTRKLLSSVAESAFYYTTFSIKQLGSEGDTEALEQNWDRLEGGMLQGLTDMVKLLGSRAAEVRTALREHYRVVSDPVLGDDPAIGPRLHKQRAKLLMLAGKL